MEQLRGLVRGEQREPGLLDDFSAATTMSRKKRLYGFVGCFVFGVLLSVLSTLFLPQLATKPGKFAVCYTLGNLLALFSTGFLVGPWKQLKTMFAPERMIATIVYMAAMVLTLYTCIRHGRDRKGAIIVYIVVQMCALLWYSLSYIPFARRAVRKCVTAFFKDG